MEIKGKEVDNYGRCKHYHKKEGVVAIKFKCCSEFYACYKCHDELNEHERVCWEKNELNKKLVLCGVCKQLMSAKAYLNSSKCTNCDHEFNPNCSFHYHLYFNIPDF